jgi:predicted esterase
MRLLLAFIIFLLGLLSNQHLYARGEIDIIAGQTILRTAPGETGVTYYIHTPENFIKDDLRPVVILFSAGGDGLGILNRIWEGAEEGGWIVIGCDSLRNNFKDRELAIKMEDEILDDIFNHLPHNPERIYMGGMSGGAWRAYNISARREEQFAGILAYGGWLGGADSQDDPYCENMSVAMINGVNDRGANAWVALDTESLRKRNCSMKHFAFMGGHQVAPPHVTQMAIDWLETDWKRKKNRRVQKLPCYTFPFSLFHRACSPEPGNV